MSEQKLILEPARSPRGWWWRGKGEESARA